MKRVFECALSTLFISFILNSCSSIKTIEEVAITYKISNRVVYTQKIEKGSEWCNSYIYESIDHQLYCSSWMDNDGTIFEDKTIVNSDITLIGELDSSLKLFTTPENEYVFVNGFNHVHSDGNVVNHPELFNQTPNKLTRKTF